MKEYRTSVILLFGLFRLNGLSRKRSLRSSFVTKMESLLSGWQDGRVVNVGSWLAEYADHIHSDHSPHSPSFALIL